MKSLMLLLVIFYCAGCGNNATLQYESTNQINKDSAINIARRYFKQKFGDSVFVRFDVGPSTYAYLIQWAKGTCPKYSDINWLTEDTSVQLTSVLGIVNSPIGFHEMIVDSNLLVLQMNCDSGIVRQRF